MINTLGKAIALIGFLGVPAFGVAGLTSNLWIGIGCHAIFSLIMFGWWIWSAYSPHTSDEGATRVDTAYVQFQSPIFGALIGLFFAAAGLGIILWAKPAEPKPGSRPMNAEEIRYFGTIIFMIGLGVFFMVVGHKKECE